ncbi:MAG: aspartate aminotransferase family protein, partial [Acidimicrobiia bacterium]|nr:aspartate aminotransferase family protein [Acidimicrobiia bacterium]
MTLPEHGLTTDEIVAALTAKRAQDVRWQEGRTFGMVYDAGARTHEAAAAAALMFLHENALNTSAFPSLGQIQSEVVG